MNHRLIVAAHQQAARHSFQEYQSLARSAISRLNAVEVHAARQSIAMKECLIFSLQSGIDLVEFAFQLLHLRMRCAHLAGGLGVAIGDPRTFLSGMVFPFSSLKKRIPDRGLRE